MKDKLTETEVKIMTQKKDTKAEETRLFFDLFDMFIKLKNGKDEDTETKLFKLLKSSDWQLIRIVKKEANNLVREYIRGILTPDADKKVGYYDAGDVLLLISMGRLEDTDIRELARLRGLTIREVLADGTKIEHYFTKLH